MNPSPANERMKRPLSIALAALWLAPLFTPSAASAAWTITPTPNVAGALSTNLTAVDCSSANSCMAVGHATNGIQGPSATVAERWDGTSWQIVPTPNAPGATFSSLNGVSCPWPSVCFAVGNSEQGPLIELWNGTSWSVQSSPDVAQGFLSAVSCSGLLACTAVGGGNGGTLAERWDGTGWHVQSTPNPGGSEDSRLSGVSCLLKRTCTAVGQSFSGAVTLPLVERWFGRVNSWGLQSAPKPAGAESASFAGVSCPGGSVCFAVGSSSGTRGVPGTLAERRIGSTWSVMATPISQDSGFGQLLGVSCPGRGACHAGGNGSGSNGVVPIAERFDAASWQLESIPDANPNLPSQAFAGVSCPSRLFCLAAGGYNVRFSGGTLAAKWLP
jgi:hypothetical protein